MIISPYYMYHAGIWLSLHIACVILGYGYPYILLTLQYAGIWLSLHITCIMLGHGYHCIINE